MRVTMSLDLVMHFHVVLSAIVASRDLIECKGWHNTRAEGVYFVNRIIGAAKMARKPACSVLSLSLW